jgi:hypothetical protein
VALDDLAASYGARVAAIVEACTDTLPDTEERGAATWPARKQRYLDHLRDASADVLLVSAADKVHNARAILADVRAVGMVAFDRFNADSDGVRWYYRSLVEVLGERFPGALVDELARTVAEIETSFAHRPDGSDRPDRAHRPDRAKTSGGTA